MTSFVLDSVKELIRPGSDSPLFWRLKPSKTRRARPSGLSGRPARSPVSWFRNQPVADYATSASPTRSSSSTSSQPEKLDLSSRWMSLAGASAFSTSSTM